VIFTPFVLSLSACLGKLDFETIKGALCNCSKKDVKEWSATNVGETVYSQRRRLFNPFKKREKKKGVFEVEGGTIILEFLLSRLSTYRESLQPTDLQGAYRFFSDPKITYQALQKPHYDKVLEKARWSEELVLFIQDGSELLFNSHPWTHGLGPTADRNGNGFMQQTAKYTSKLYVKAKGEEFSGEVTLEITWVKAEFKKYRCSSR
jgi:hypothetical protein